MLGDAKCVTPPVTEVLQTKLCANNAAFARAAWISTRGAGVSTFVHAEYKFAAARGLSAASSHGAASDCGEKLSAALRTTRFEFGGCNDTGNANRSTITVRLASGEGVSEEGTNVSGRTSPSPPSPP